MTKERKPMTRPAPSQVEDLREWLNSAKPEDRVKTFEWWCAVMEAQNDAAD